MFEISIFVFLVVYVYFGEEFVILYCWFVVIEVLRFVLIGIWYKLLGKVEKFIVGVLG